MAERKGYYLLRKAADWVATEDEWNFYDDGHCQQQEGRANWMLPEGESVFFSMGLENPSEETLGRKKKKFAARAQKREGGELQSRHSEEIIKLGKKKITREKKLLL